jgi:hypothetical protein
MRCIRGAICLLAIFFAVSTRRACAQVEITILEAGRVKDDRESRKRDLAYLIHSRGPVGRERYRTLCHRMMPRTGGDRDNLVAEGTF